MWPHVSLSGHEFKPRSICFYIAALGGPLPERSCFRPDRKLHLKLARQSEWLISHLAGMKVNERSKERATRLRYNPSQARFSHPADSRRLAGKVSQSGITVWSEKKKKKPKQQTWRWKPASIFLPTQSPPVCAQPFVPFWFPLLQNLVLFHVFLRTAERHRQRNCTCTEISF